MPAYLQQQAPLLFEENPDGSLWFFEVDPLFPRRSALLRVMLAMETMPDFLDATDQELPQIQTLQEHSLTGGIANETLVEPLLLAIPPAAMGFAFNWMPHAIVFLFGHPTSLLESHPPTFASLYVPRLHGSGCPRSFLSWPRSSRSRSLLMLSASATERGGTDDRVHRLLDIQQQPRRTGSEGPRRLLTAREGQRRPRLWRRHRRQLGGGDEVRRARIDPVGTERLSLRAHQAQALLDFVCRDEGVARAGLDQQLALLIGQVQPLVAQYAPSVADDEPCLCEPTLDRHQRRHPVGVGGGHCRQEALRHPLVNVLRRDRPHEHQPVGRERAVCLCNGHLRTLQLMEHKRQQDAVERAVGDRELLCAPNDPIDGAAVRQRPLARKGDEALRVSTPVALADAARAIASAKPPVPQPTSSTRWPGPIWPISTRSGTQKARFSSENRSLKCSVGSCAELNLVALRTGSERSASSRTSHL